MIQPRRMPRGLSQFTSSYGERLRGLSSKWEGSGCRESKVSKQVGLYGPHPRTSLLTTSDAVDSLSLKTSARRQRCQGRETYSFRENRNLLLTQSSFMEEREKDSLQTLQIHSRNS